MLFGRTTAQKEQAEQERLKLLYEHRTRKFAWLPVRLADGRYAWLQWVWWSYKYWSLDGPLYYDPMGKHKSYFLTET